MTPQKRLPQRQQWNVRGTSVNKKTGEHYVYVVTLEIDGTWKCSCPAWMFQKKNTWVNGKRVDCQHILRKQIEIGAVEVKGPVSVTTKMEDDKITRSITFEDV